MTLSERFAQIERERAATSSSIKAPRTSMLVGRQTSSQQPTLHNQNNQDNQSNQKNKSDRSIVDHHQQPSSRKLRPPQSHSSNIAGNGRPSTTAAPPAIQQKQQQQLRNKSGHTKAAALTPLPGKNGRSKPDKVLIKSMIKRLGPKPGPIENRLGRRMEDRLGSKPNPSSLADRVAALALHRTKKTKNAAAGTGAPALASATKVAKKNSSRKRRGDARAAAKGVAQSAALEGSTKAQTEVGMGSAASGQQPIASSDYVEMTLMDEDDYTFGAAPIY
ncbi:hypothetical protein BASA50_000111 [Batrachochytrium salamandrivorans]|uniref:Uncharacterized protein n=1 Tax=Batrachochytrium salamandrivorans TaxID=1357716 RepID=A0ABQ8EXY8_9FUNG|nr:hypothetical protein BASA60_000458 [Batrachochytrium salamandrivorans]KAH6578862.1 hypothetical protein BASA61_000393 [Batrachochytrium salamandrivorans]KAH6587063.1 hypothetical protein BASA50_000111 [Batrachochytrium salamandrivorans]KAH9244600.1 hypothetical protein BASA81_017989 [Batrachochytrium salamandrivorans]KAH9270397.1 hypothetical protein BASA83_007560 [Batrachochytrium salamandrivorans]